MADDKPDVTVKARVERPGISIWQAAGTLGIGSVLALLIVPRLQDSSDRKDSFIQEKLVGTLQATAATQAEQTAALQQLTISIQNQTAAQQQQAAALNMFLPRVDENIAAQRELAARLKTQSSRLDRVADGLAPETAEVKP